MTSHSDALRRRWADPAYRARQIAALRRAVAIRQAQLNTPEARALWGQRLRDAKRKQKGKMR